MSAADAAFLYLERKAVPLHIASVCIFDGPIPFKKFVASINSKLHLVPRYRQVPVVPAWDLDFPFWQDDPNFDIRRHIIPITLPGPGGEAELQALASRILSQLLDRDKPLWDVHVVDGLKGGRGALIWRLHHALADGVSGTELMKLMLDATADVPGTFPKPRYRRTRATAPHPGAVNISGALTSTLGRFIEFEAGMLGLARAVFSEYAPGTPSENKTSESKKNTLKGLFGLLPEFTASIERLPFNKPCTGERKFCWAEFELADVQAIRDSVGGTVNDVILAVVTRGLSRYVRLHNQSVVNRYVRIVCPVNLRAQEKGGLGNQISFLPVALPLDARGPVRMLQAVTARTEILKECGALGFVGLAAKWFSAVPPPLQALFWRNIPEVILPVPLLNMICTNVVGSAAPLYAVGRRMLTAYPQVPTGWDLGVGCAVQSYNGKLFFGLIADTHAAPDVERLRDFLVASFHELRRSAAAKKVRVAQRLARATAKREEQEAAPVSAITQEPANAVAPSASAATAPAGHTKEAA